MKKALLTSVSLMSLAIAANAQSFTAGNLVVLQTSGTASKAPSVITLKEFTTSGTAGQTFTLPSTGVTPLLTSGVYGGSEGFLTTSTDNKYIVLGGYHSSNTSVSDITGTASGTTPRAVGLVYPSGFYLEFDTSQVFYTGNDIRGAVSDGTNFWASGASNASVDGIDYFGPSAHTTFATGTTPAKAYGLRIFNGQVYYSTQKSGPSNSSSQLGVFTLGSLPTSGTASPTQVINTGSLAPEDFSFNSTGDICYIAIAANSASGGIQKWTKSGSAWSLAYTLGTGATNIGAYGLVVDYSGSNPVIYATTFETTGNRVIKVVDNGSSATAITLVAATTNTFYKGITFAPVFSGTPLVNLTVSTDTASEAGATVVTVTANTSAPVAGAQTVSLAVSGTGITSGDYTLSNTTITIPNGATSGSVTFTVTDDILGEGTEVANLTISSPSSGITLGMRPTQHISIADNDGNNHPAIIVDTATTTKYLDAGLTPSSPFRLSAVAGDPTDPAITLGVDMLVKDLETASAGLTLTFHSNNQSVIPDTNIIVTGTDSIRNIKIKPLTVGYADITLTVSDGTDSTSYVLSYGVSAASNTPNNTFWHTGMSDGSDGIALDDNYYVSGDDELNVLNVYSRNASGLPLVSYNYTSNLSLPDPGKPEADIEAATRSFVNSGRVYWLGSMSNGKAPFDNKPNRDRIFATTISGTGASTSFTFAGWAALRTSLLAWGDTHGYSFSSSAAQGVDSKTDSGFAAEGMVFAPDSTTLYLGLRAPLVPTANRTKAVIVPIQNFETWFNNGSPAGNPTYGSPIELDLGGRGIRDITRLSNGTYIILAGSSGSNVKGAIYKWTGKATDAPIKVVAPTGDTLNMEGVMQINTGGQLSLSSLQIVTDKGDDIYYNDGTEAKDFADLQMRKFRSDVFTSLDLTMPTDVKNIAANSSSVLVYPNPTTGQLNIQFTAVANEQYKLMITDIKGAVVAQYSGVALNGKNTLVQNLSSLSKGMYLIHLSSASINYNQKIILQ